MSEMGQPLDEPYPWHQALWSRLATQSQNKILAHALMFCGMSGIGKEHLALSFSRYLLCLAPKEGTACGKCKGCQLNRAGTHPDLLHVSPEGSGTFVKVDQIRALNDFLSRTAQQGGLKVAVVTPAEAMNANAANALLKNLEEPTRDTFFFLVSHGKSRVMPTIRSRCQMIDMAVPQTDAVVPWLSKLLPDEDALKLLDMVGGAPLAALQLVQEGMLEARRQLDGDLLNMARGKAFPISCAKNWLELEALNIVDWIGQLLHRGMIEAALIQEQQAGNSFSTAGGELFNMLSNCDKRWLFKYYDKLMDSKRVLQSGINPNKQLLLEELCLGWCTLVKSGSPNVNRP